MQNKVQIWDMNLNLKSVFECRERCILYSAHLCYENYKNLIVLSGTVFNEILIWRLSKDDSGYAPVLKTLQKHEVSNTFSKTDSNLICCFSRVLYFLFSITNKMV